MPTLYVAPTANFVSKTLNGSITDSATTISLNNATNMQAPGVVVIDRTDSAGNSTPNAREVISYTGISGSDLTGCTRGAENSTARSHSDGAIVETMPTVGLWNSLATIVATAVTSDSYLKPIASPVSISAGRFITSTLESISSAARIQVRELVTASAASIPYLFVSQRLEISAASVTGIGLFPVWRSSAAYSGPTIGIGGVLKAPKVGAWQWISVLTPRVASGASVVFDVMNNGTSIFAGVTKPTIVGAGTYVSTASINTKAISPGNDLRADINAIASGAGVIQDITVQGGTV